MPGPVSRRPGRAGAPAMRRAVSAGIGTGRKPAGLGQACGRWPVTGFLFRDQYPERGRKHRRYAGDLRRRRASGDGSSSRTSGCSRIRAMAFREVISPARNRCTHRRTKNDCSF